MLTLEPRSSFFFFNDTATTEIYTLSLHDALPISRMPSPTPISSAFTRRHWAAPTSISTSRRAPSRRMAHRRGWEWRSGKGRVGEEGRFRGAPDYLKKKKKKRLWGAIVIKSDTQTGR